MYSMCLIAARTVEISTRVYCMLASGRETERSVCTPVHMDRKAVPIARSNPVLLVSHNTYLQDVKATHRRWILPGSLLSQVSNVCI